jgi:hypothetical protein
LIAPKIYTLSIKVLNNEPFTQRIYPDKGVAIKEHQPTLVFATVCIKGSQTLTGHGLAISWRGVQIGFFVVAL